MGRQSSQGKRGLKSSSVKRVTANRGGTRSLPATRRVTGAFGVAGPERRSPPRSAAAGKAPTARRRD